MKRILIASVSEEENLILRRKLEPLTEEIGNVSYVTTRPQALIYSARENFQLIIFNVAEFNSDHRAIIEKVRELGFRESLIVCAKAKNPSVIQEVNSLQSTVFVERPYETKDMLGVVSKLLRLGAVSQRIFRRYYTMQKTEIEFVEEHRKASTTLYNLSKGGAYVEFSHSQNVKIGDALTLHVPLNEVRRTYEMPARVVWTTASGSGGGFGVGLEFVGPGDVQRKVFGSLE